jgi:hypothetical protein
MIVRPKLTVRGVRHDRPQCLSLAELGLAVTIGIAAKPATSEYIVTVTDMRISFGDIIPGIDLAQVKMYRLDQYWGLLFAADETGYVRPIVDHARAELSKIDGRATTLHVRSAVIDAYQSIRSEVAFTRYLKQYGYSSMEEFRLNPGFPDKITGQLMQEVDAFDLSVHFLIYGFDENGSARFIQIRNPGEAVIRDELDYWAVGSGFNMAMATLTTRSNSNQSVEALVYRCCEAKFVSEFARDVGKATSVAVWYPDGTFALILSSHVDRLRNVYERTRRQSIPTEAKTEIEGVLALEGERRAAEAREIARASVADEPTAS